MTKKVIATFPARVTVEIPDTEKLSGTEFRDKAQRAVRRLGYMTLSDFLREKMQEAIYAADRAVTAAGA